MQPKTLAHRGFSAKYPENTALAFLKGIEAGADGIECDIQKTKDGAYVVLHDEDVDRTSNGKGRIDQMTLADARALDFGQGERILTLEELLAKLPNNRWINIEVKSGTLKYSDNEKIAQIVKKNHALDHILFSSFEHEWLPVYRKHGFITGMLLGEEHQSLGPLGLAKRILMIRPTYINLPVQAFERLTPTNLGILLKVFRLLGRRLIFWTVNERAQFDLVHNHCDFIITDEVEGVLNWMKEG